MKKLVLIVAVCLCSWRAAAQMTEIADSASIQSIMQKCQHNFPKFYNELMYVKSHDGLIKHIAFSPAPLHGGSPAFAEADGVINIDAAYLLSPKPNFDDNRLIVVLYHEIGHLHYFATINRNNWTPEESEKAAFEYSLLRTKELAVKGDCGPLKTGLKFMKLRSQSNNVQDAHVRALKRMVTEPLYFDYLKYVAEKCG